MARKQYDMTLETNDCELNQNGQSTASLSRRIWHNRVYDLQLEKAIHTYSASRRFNDESY